MVVLQAPFESPLTVIRLRNPQYNNSEALSVGLNFRRAMDGTPYTYIKKPDARIIEYSFSLKRDDAFELEKFIDLYVDDNIRVIDHESAHWKVKLTVDTFEISQDRRNNVVLTFEGKRL